MPPRTYSLCENPYGLSHTKEEEKNSKMKSYKISDFLHHNESQKNLKSPYDSQMNGQILFSDFDVFS